MNVEQISVHISLKRKIDELISAYEKQKEQNHSLLAKVNNLEGLIQEKERALQELESKYNQQQLGKAVLASSGNSHDAKLMVSKIVREIDQCIALLNRY